MVVTDLQYALSYDSRPNAQPLNYETDHPGGGASTYVSYQKGKILWIFLLKSVSCLNWLLIILISKFFFCFEIEFLLKVWKLKEKNDSPPIFGRTGYLFDLNIRDMFISIKIYCRNSYAYELNKSAVLICLSSWSIVPP